MKVGIVGSGNMGKTHINAYKQCGVNELYICDTNFENAQKIALENGGEAFADFSQMLEAVDLDCVSICVPTPLHNKLSMMALEKGIPVLCEKPFATTVVEAEEMAKKAKEKDCILMIAHCLRFFKPYIYLKKAIQDKRFGKLLSLNMTRHATMPLWSEGDWFSDMENSGGAVIDLHIHETDIAVFLLGEPNDVTAVGDYSQCSTIYHYDAVAVGAQSSWRKPRRYPFTCGYDANFEDATVIFNGGSVQVICGEEIFEDVIEKEEFPAYIQSDNMYENEIRYFLSAVKSGDCSYCDCMETLISTKTVHKELENILSKK